MLILWQKREFYNGFTERQANEPHRCDKFGDKAKVPENAEIVILSLQGTEIPRTFERNLCDITPCRKRYKNEGNPRQSGRLILCLGKMDNTVCCTAIDPTTEAHTSLRRVGFTALLPSLSATELENVLL
ncbi:hypothetical protein AVEN_272835-1 [Araneus ventricosus]|uniref:Uncharacterized protein n=1 Tax=Araneus ventricosus TaxID=182803 RepID=A0A4Y2TDS2_ARAVE|nr:hypothetical protein AVEN_272835-1 [Araneus ventricosus]